MTCLATVNTELKLSTSPTLPRCELRESMLDCSTDRKGGAADYDEGKTPTNPCDFPCLDSQVCVQAVKGPSLTEATSAENPKAGKFRRLNCRDQNWTQMQHTQTAEV